MEGLAPKPEGRYNPTFVRPVCPETRYREQGQTTAKVVNLALRRAGQRMLLVGFRGPEYEPAVFEELVLAVPGRATNL